LQHKTAGCSWHSVAMIKYIPAESIALLHFLHQLQPRSLNLSCLQQKNSWLQLAPCILDQAHSCKVKCIAALWHLLQPRSLILSCLQQDQLAAAGTMYP
ncbi:MAG: hypothetical protein ACKPKO_55710, partial [Candidatus Fonsibacter sp.]